MWLGTAEARSSWFQSHVLAALATRMRYEVKSGPSESISFRARGPYDERLGYAGIPGFAQRAEGAGFAVTAQARNSATAMAMSRLGLYPVYGEKAQAGLQIFDREGREFLRQRFPERVYASYGEIPHPVVEALLFIENRTVLDRKHPHRNPAVEWTRLSRAVFEYGGRPFHRGQRSIGASTLATQLEKVRHSPRGRTHSAGEKLVQMLSASLSAYREGRNTLQAQEQIVCDYLNSLPLGARPESGEVIGLGDGLWAWYGEDFGRINGLLRARAEDLSEAERRQQALAYREVLSLLIATRSPARYLGADQGALNELTDQYLRALATADVIPQEVRALALPQRPAVRTQWPAAATDFVAGKGANLVRTDLASLLGVDSTYALDRLDLSVRTTLDEETQQRTTAVLEGLAGGNPGATAALRQPHLLGGSDAGAVIYSFTLFERGGGFNLLRVQTDTFRGPLNINEGTKLELGSTAKLRTLIEYLQIVERLHAQLAGGAQTSAAANDPLTAWAADYRGKATDRGLRPMLEAALDRRYPASPGESFFTAGGLHSFSNFEPLDNRRILTVREAFERSVNLVFIRLMRDIERYYLARLPGGGVPANVTGEERRRYLARFADQEGSVYVTRFYRRHSGQSAEEALEALCAGDTGSPTRLAVIYRSLRPEASQAEFAAFLRKHTLPGLITEKYVADLYEKYAPGKFNLQDRGYLARVHPLELWLLGYERLHPGASLGEVLAASGRERQEAYAWLFRTQFRGAQNLRIRILQEQEAFRPITREWRALGYPFETLVPSYATSIGVSGDTPAALGELMGVIASGGVRSPTAELLDLRFGSGTPVETVLERRPAKGERVLSEEVARTVRGELIAVVERGSARRAAGGFRMSDGRVLPLGGKTGTGDNRLRIYAGRGYLVGSHPVSRTAVFAYMIGDRYYGTVMAFVPGTAAARYEFTSALAVQVFKELEPAIRPLLERR